MVRDPCVDLLAGEMLMVDWVGCVARWGYAVEA
jgi:hypothetical protein